MELKEKKEFKVVGMDTETDVQNASKVCHELWMKFMKRAGEIKNRVDEKIDYGVSFVLPEKGECDFRHIACVEVSEVEDVPEGMVSETVPAQKYAVYEHKGKLEKLGETYGFIMEDLKKRGIKESGIWFEYYDERFKMDSDDSVMEIWCGIKE